MGAEVWTAELSTLNQFALLGFCAFVAWLAFAVFDTNAGVTIFPERWRDIGVPLALWCIVQELWTAVAIWASPPPPSSAWVVTFTEVGQLQFGWLAAALLAAALAEEIVYRALLLRALEGYMRSTRALVLQAAVFELVHAFVYGMGLSGVPFVGGLVLGWAFQRTRSLAVPTLLHAAHNILFSSLVWYFNQ